MIPVADSLDLNRNWLLNCGVQVLATAPSTPITGHIYFDSVLNQFRLYNGTVWLDNTNVALASLITGTTPISVTPSGNGVVISIGTASASAAGTMSAADFTKLLNATANATAGTLVLRDGAGRFQVVSPISANDVANKQYVDDLINGKDWKDSVRVATTTNITLTGAQTIDGVAVIAGDRVLVKDQTTGSQNGIYTVAAGAWVRATDADVNAEVTTGLTTLVEQGTANGSSGWSINTQMPITVGTTSLSFIKTMQTTIITAGAGILQTGSSFDIVPADGSMTINADSLQVKLVPTGGIGVNASGLFVQSYTPVAGATVTRTWVSPSTPIGNGTAVTFTHNLGNIASLVSVKNATTNVGTWCQITQTNANTVDVTANGTLFNVIVTVQG
jgi:hypothetical protein